VSLVTTGFLVQSSHWDTSPFPEVDLQVVALDANALQFVRFDADDEDWLSAITGSRSAPRPQRIQSVDIRLYAQRAGLRPGQPVTVVLSLEIRSDGTVRAVAVARSCGDRRIDGLAVDYARLLSWIPGTVDKQPQTMRVVYPVTLVIPLVAVSRN
jgi:TonB family protein